MSKPVICTDTGEWFPSAAEAARAMRIPNPQSVSCCLRGKTVSAGGHKWRYAEDSERHGRPSESSGRVLWDMRTKPVACIEEGILFPSIKDAAAYAGVSQARISQVLARRECSAAGFHWRYATPDEVAGGRYIARDADSDLLGDSPVVRIGDRLAHRVDGSEDAA